MNLKKVTTDKLFEMLNEITASTAERIKKMAEILQELHCRGQSHPLMKDGILRHYAPIASGRLSPLAAVRFSGAKISDVLIGLPLEEQDRLANGGKIIVAEHDRRGEIVPVDKLVEELSMKQLTTVIQKGKVRSFNEQKKDVAKREPDVRRSPNPLSFRYDSATCEVVCGRMRFGLEELADVIREAGYEPLKLRKSRMIGAGHEAHTSM